MKKVKTAGGDELSEEDIEALADEAERGYGHARHGRPALGGLSGVSPRVQVRVDPQLATELKARARKEHRLSARSLREYVDRAA